MSVDVTNSEFLQSFGLQDDVKNARKDAGADVT